MNEADDPLPDDVLRLREQIQTWAEQNDLWGSARWIRPEEESGKWVDSEETPTVLILAFEDPLYRVFWDPYDECEKLHKQFREMLKQAGFWYNFENEYRMTIYRTRKREGGG